MKKPIAIATFLAAIVALCIAGTKISRLTQTRTIQGNSLFVTVTGTPPNAITVAIEATNLISELARFPTWTNSVTAIGTSVGVKTNGVTVSATATSLDIITGSNTVVKATNTAGAVTVQINASATGGSGTTETQWFPDLTQFYTNASGGFGIKSTSVQTNAGFYAGSILSVPLTINGVAGQDGNLFNVKNYLGNILFGLSYDGSMINPILDSTSTAGYIWTATGTDGVGDWVIPAVTTAILNLATNAVYVLETTRNAAVSNALVALELTRNAAVSNAVIAYTDTASSNRVSVAPGIGTSVATNGPAGVMTYTVSSLTGTNYPTPVRIGTNVAVGSGSRQFVTLQTNATFILNFQGTPINGENVRVGISNISASTIFMTNFNGGSIANCFDPYVASNVTVFPIAGTSVRIFDFVFSTNFNLGTIRQELHWSSEKQHEIAAGQSMVLTTNGNTISIGTTNSLHDWAQYSTNVWNSRQGGNSVLSNLVITAANNVTNFVSLSTSNATSKPLSNSYTAGVLTLYGLEQGTNAVIYNNGSNLVINAQPAGGGLVTNGNQFGASTTLTIKDGARLTNTVHIGDSITVLTTNDATLTNVVIDCKVVGNHVYVGMMTNTLFIITNLVAGHPLFLETVQTNGGGFNWFFQTNIVSFSEQPFLPANTNLGMANLISFKTFASGTRIYGWQSTGFP